MCGGRSLSGAARAEQEEHQQRNTTPPRQLTSPGRLSSTSAHPFAADVSDEAGPNTTGATAGHVDETDLLDPSVPLDPWTPGPLDPWTPEEDYPPVQQGVRACDGGNRPRPRGWASTELD